MAREARSKTIDGLEFTVQQLPAMRASKLIPVLVKWLGPGMLRALAGADFAAGGIKATDLDLEGMATGLQHMTAQFGPNDLEWLIKELCETATVRIDGNELPLMRVFDDAMAGRVGAVFKLIVFALEVNYQDFFGELLASAGLRRKAPLSKV